MNHIFKLYLFTSAIFFILNISQAILPISVPMNQYGHDKDTATGPIYLNKGQLKEFAVNIEKGQFTYKKTGEKVSGLGKYILTLEGDFYYYDPTNPEHERIRGDRPFYHSSFFAGAPVAMAGWASFLRRPGVLYGISDGSGHYRPRGGTFDQMLEYLMSKEKGVVYDFYVSNWQDIKKFDKSQGGLNRPQTYQVDTPLNPFVIGTFNVLHEAQAGWLCCKRKFNKIPIKTHKKETRK